MKYIILTIVIVVLITIPGLLVVKSTVQEVIQHLEGGQTWLTVPMPTPCKHTVQGKCTRM